MLRSGACALALALAALLGAAPATAQTRAPTPPPVLGPSPEADRHIPFLSDLLEALKPSVDTSLPESSRAAINRLEKQLDDGQTAAALQEIEQKLAEAEEKAPQSTNVQLLFLKARALNQSGRRAEAKAIYQDMTQRFPELPEPWNNLAALEVADGHLEQAKTALEMAVRTDPNYAIARENLGDLYIMLAARSYGAAEKLDPQDPRATQKQTETRKVLEGSESQDAAKRTQP